jgi:hypothetical protein
MCVDAGDQGAKTRASKVYRRWRARCADAGDQGVNLRADKVRRR